MPTARPALRGAIVTPRRLRLLILAAIAACALIAAGTWLRRDADGDAGASGVAAEGEDQGEGEVERIRIEEEIGFQGEAREEPFLAAERFFSAMGWPAERRRQLVELPPTDYLLFLMADRRHFGDRRRRELLEWVEAGGHLIVRPFGDGVFLIDDPLLTELGLDWYSVADVPWETLSDEEPITEATSATDRGTYTVALPDGSDLRVARYGYVAVYWTDVDGEPTWWHGPDAGPDALDPTMVHVERGGGGVTVVADPAVFTNAHAGENDHAELLWQLANLQGPRAGVWMIRTDAARSFLAILAAAFWPAAGGGLLLLGLWLWRGSWRFGPPIAEESHQRRSLEDHLRAAGRIQTRYGGVEALLASTRSAFQSALHRRAPEWSGALDRDPDGIAALAARSGLSEDRILSALDVDDTRPRDWAQRIADLEALRHSL